MTIIRSFLILLFLSVPVAAKTVPESQQQIQLSYAPLVKQVAPAVVNIYTRKTVEQRVSPLFENPFFRQFFGRNFGQQFGAPRKRVQNSLGSGVILRDEGIVVTNHHVINGADEITVVLTDRREFDAEVIVSDERTDLAVLRMKTDGEKLPTASLRDSDEVEVGDLVLAIGNPFGVGQTVTSGIVSALARTNVGVSDYQSFIQTDAPINPGNSGGALVTMDGQLLGINTAIFSKSGGSVGIGFAIPANMVRFVVDSALNEGKVVRPWLGAGGQSVTSDMALALGLDRPVGVLVNEVYEEGPADLGGLRGGDIVLSVNDYDVYEARTLQYRFASMEPGGRAKLGILRNGQPDTLYIELKPAPEKPKRDVRIVEGWTPLSGAKVANLSPALSDELGVDTMSGVIVLGVQRRTQAAANGLRRGDIITAVNDQPVETYAEVDDLIDSDRNSREVWRLTVTRGDNQGTLDVTIRQ